MNFISISVLLNKRILGERQGLFIKTKLIRDKYVCNYIKVYAIKISMTHLIYVNCTP